MCFPNTGKKSAKWAGLIDCHFTKLHARERILPIEGSLSERALRKDRAITRTESAGTTAIGQIRLSFTGIGLAWFRQKLSSVANNNQTTTRKQNTEVML
jgi:hypothetical protein